MISVLNEQTHYSYNDLHNKMNNLNNHEFKDLLDKLAKSNILIKKNKLNTNELFDDYLTDEIILNPEINETYIFKFVGIIQTNKNNIILVYPKYIDKEKTMLDYDKNNQKKFSQIINVISKYKNRLSQNLIKPNEIKEQIFNNLGIKLKIISSYHTHGLYNREKETYNNNSRGQILWNKTVNQNTAHLVNGIPVYLDFQAIEKDLNINDEVRLIHISILNYIPLEISPILQILNVPSVLLDEVEAYDETKIDYYLYILQKELKNEYVTYKQNIIKELIIFLKNQSAKMQDEINIVGTTSFELVWEDVCSVTYENHLSKSLIDLNLETDKSINKHSKLKEYIEKPKWIGNKGNIIHSKSSLELDVLNIDKPYFNIYDAKYYNIRVGHKKIRNTPGVADVTKQYLYQLVFDELITKNSLIPNNFFIVPKDELEIDNSELTSVSFDMFDELNLEPIKVIGRDCETIFKEYLSK
ncbi:LlaJI family restriction endonuclease [Staphylococcus haemolyticus]|uniref:LlaJI family restriction endonuclease n=1 Tax=Staphylococcus haemolyticus TaxID=1283 RepID=UPI001F0A1BFC|nr:LlaJI family restriction endonuclease [Staphylococcus haemolyticus]MCH4334059.1 LlaJI family restriction endonuclease [Staphylococcus haemolyticus]